MDEDVDEPILADKDIGARSENDQVGNLRIELGS